MKNRSPTDLPCRPSRAQREAVRVLMKIGGLMSNICFNLGQHGSGKTLSAHESGIAYTLQRQWDDAMNCLIMANEVATPVVKKGSKRVKSR